MKIIQVLGNDCREQNEFQENLEKNSQLWTMIQKKRTLIRSIF